MRLTEAQAERAAEVTLAQLEEHGGELLEFIRSTALDPEMRREWVVEVCAEWHRAERPVGRTGAEEYGRQVWRVIQLYRRRLAGEPDWRGWFTACPCGEHRVGLVTDLETRRLLAAAPCGVLPVSLEPLVLAHVEQQGMGWLRQVILEAYGFWQLQRAKQVAVEGVASVTGWVFVDADELGSAPA